MRWSIEESSSLVPSVRRRNLDMSSRHAHRNCRALTRRPRRRASPVLAAIAVACLFRVAAAESAAVLPQEAERDCAIGFADDSCPAPPPPPAACGGRRGAERGFLQSALRRVRGRLAVAGGATRSQGATCIVRGHEPREMDVRP
eukprot:Selendium_serpulae@DN2582_c0_g1_i2.p2